MKKFISLFIALIISACLSPSGGATPQVTVTSEVTVTLAPPTTIPTPTLHPDFIALQELISSSGRYILTADGFIYENGLAIAGLQVDLNGKMTLTVNNEKIILATSDIIFAEDGIKINGYELDENGEWVEAVSEAMQTATELVAQYNVDPETVTVTEEGALVNVTDNETGKVLIRTNGIQSWYGLEFAADTIAADSCESTPFKPNSYGLMPGEYGLASVEYLRMLRVDLNYMNSDNIKIFPVLIDREKQCWGFANSKYLLYRDNDGVAQKLPLIAFTEEEKTAFLESRADK